MERSTPETVDVAPAGMIELISERASEVTESAR